MILVWRLRALSSVLLSVSIAAPIGPDRGVDAAHVALVANGAAGYGTCVSAVPTTCPETPHVTTQTGKHEGRNGKKPSVLTFVGHAESCTLFFKRA